MSGFCSKLTAYMLIGWVGFVATVAMIGSLFTDWAVVAGWVTIISTTIVFYLTTIEAPYVECEWASFITIPAGVVMIFAGSEPINYLVAVAGPLMLAYGLAEVVAPRFPRLSGWLKVEPRRARATARREAKLLQLEQEQARFLASQNDFSL